MVKPFLQVVDHFYSKPERVREKALSMEYSEQFDFHSWRTRVWQPKGLRKRIESVFRIQIKYWEADVTGDDSCNGVFFSAFSRGPRAEMLKVHFDEPPDWISILVYLTPNAARDTGTSFWQHRETGLIARPTKRDALRLGLESEELEIMLDRDGWNRKCWIEIDRIGNIYNRAVMFRAGRFHSATRHFGGNLNDGRLYHSFHFQISSKTP
jgi:hypothetical protein